MSCVTFISLFLFFYLLSKFVEIVNVVEEEDLKIEDVEQELLEGGDGAEPSSNEADNEAEELMLDEADPADTNGKLLYFILFRLQICFISGLLVLLANTPCVFYAKAFRFESFLSVKIVLLLAKFKIIDGKYYIFFDVNRFYNINMYSTM